MISGSDRTSSGFTLLELLVALIVLSLLTGLLIEALRFGGRSWLELRARHDAAYDLRLAYQALSGRLEQIVPLATTPRAGTPGEQFFDGRRDSLLFASTLPEHAGGEIDLMRLELIDRSGQQDLVLRFWPAWAGREPPADSDLALVLGGTAGVEFSYFAADPDHGGWLSEWRRRSDLPRAIKVQVRFADGDQRTWQDLVVRPMVDALPDTY